MQQAILLLKPYISKAFAIFIAILFGAILFRRHTDRRQFVVDVILMVIALSLLLFLLIPTFGW